ncbi:Vacuolar H-ATPase V1 sector, subunit G [Ceraceosorus bombacis]|uniref:Vacuolar H-ATPase V1 sector, subunit G n=1 Tax=Ceraceosorus bombacis TaxID=401625 RepID=A0A0P1BMV7_9BASI|nr:Vacuolar H-ATPase V1 sector, subunit G [Ceraceosorus bombacis]
MLEPPPRSMTSRLATWLSGNSRNSQMQPVNAAGGAFDIVPLPLFHWSLRFAALAKQHSPTWLADVVAQIEPHAGSILTAALTIVLIAFLTSTIIKRRKESARPVSVAVPHAVQAGWNGMVLPYPTVSSKAHPRLITCYDPSTAQHISDIQADDASAIFEKVRRAQAAQRAWGDSEFARRRRVLRTIKQWLANDMEIVVKVACRDTGKTAVDALLGEILTTFSKLDWLIGNTEAVLKTEVRPSNLLLAHKRCKVFHRPLGVVAACVSWNYPVHNLISPAIAALAAGNSVVVKVSEQVAWSSRYILTALQACLVACGESPDLVQVVVCYPGDAEALTANPAIKHMTFIGSETVAKLVAQSAAKAMIPTCMELGGADPMIILENVDLKYFAPTWMRGTFGAAGQNCIGAERFIVSSKIVDKFIALMAPRIEALKPGSFLADTPFSDSKDVKQAGDHVEHVDIGPLITGARIEALEAIIADAVKAGARVIIGGKRYAHPKHAHGHYFQPTLIVDIKPDMTIAQEELFAPIFRVMSFDSLDDAIALANGTRYGLGSSVFGSNKKQCMYVASKLDAGMCNINDFACGYLNQGLPFGGVKASGYGRFAGPEGLRALTSPKATTEDIFFSAIRTAIPPPLDYPLTNPTNAWSFAQGLGNFVGGSLSQKARGIFALIRGSL